MKYLPYLLAITIFSVSYMLLANNKPVYECAVWSKSQLFKELNTSGEDGSIIYLRAPIVLEDGETIWGNENTTLSIEGYYGKQ